MSLWFNPLLSAAAAAAAGGAAATFEAAGTATATGSAGVTTAITLAAAGTATAAGSAALTTAIPLAAEGTATATGSAGVTTAITLAAEATATAAGSAALTTAIPLAAAGTAYVVGPITDEGGGPITDEGGAWLLDGDGVMPALTTAITLAAAGTATATGAVALATDILLAGVGTTTATGDATLTTAIPLAAEGTATATGEAAIPADSTLGAAGTATATGAGALTTAITLAGAAYGYAAGDASLADVDVEPADAYARLAAAATAVGSGVADLYIPGDVTLAAEGTATATGEAAITTGVSLAASGATDATGAVALTTAIPLAAEGTATATGVVVLASPHEMLGTGTATATGAAALTTAIILAAEGTATATAAPALATAITLAGSGRAVAGSDPDPHWPTVVLLLHAAAPLTDASGRHTPVTVGSFTEVADSDDWTPGAEYTWEGQFALSFPQPTATATVLVEQAGAFAIELIGPDANARTGFRFRWTTGGIEDSFEASWFTVSSGVAYAWGVALIDDMVQMFINGALVAEGLIAPIDNAAAVVRINAVASEVRFSQGLARFWGGYAPAVGRLSDDNAYAALSSYSPPMEAVGTATATGTVDLAAAASFACGATATATGSAALTTAITLAAEGTVEPVATADLVIRHDCFAAGFAMAEGVADLYTAILLAAEPATATATATVRLANVNNVDTTRPVAEERLIRIPHRQRVLYVIPRRSAVRTEAGVVTVADAGVGAGTPPRPSPPLAYDRAAARSRNVRAAAFATVMGVAALTTAIPLAAAAECVTTATATLTTAITLAAEGTATASGAAEVFGDPWTPTELVSTPAAWFNDDSPLTEVSGYASQWDDLTGNALHVVQATAGNRPLVNAAGLNGRRTLTFDGANDRMGRSGFMAYGAVFRNKNYGWALAVARKTSLDASPTLRTVFYASAWGSTGDRFAAYLSRSTNSNNYPVLSVRRLDADSLATLQTAGAIDTSWHVLLYVMDWSAGDGYIHLDGGTPVTNTALTSSGSTSDTQANNNDFYIGATNGGASGFPAMDIAELVVGNAALTAGEIDRLIGYAAHRWGLATNLPADHPYKNAPPTI